MEYETIDSAQVDDLMARVSVRKPGDWTISYKDEDGIESHPESKGKEKPKTEELPAASTKSNDTPSEES